jgi:hypothetical protein
MDKKQKKRLEEIRAQFNEVKGFSSGQTWNDKLEFLFTLIDEQAAEVKRLREVFGEAFVLIDTFHNGEAWVEPLRAALGGKDD